MNDSWTAAVAGQLGAAADMLGNAIRACPETLWHDPERQPAYWYVAFHALFWLDFYLADSADGFTPPPPFGLEELDPAGVLPAHPYAKDQLLAYLEHGRHRLQARLEGLDRESAARRWRFGSVDLTVGELLLYNLRHVQHHTAQLNLLLRQTAGFAPPWVKRAGVPSPTSGE